MFWLPFQGTVQALQGCIILSLLTECHSPLEHQACIQTAARSRLQAGQELCIPAGGNVQQTCTMTLRSLSLIC